MFKRFEYREFHLKDTWHECSNAVMRLGIDLDGVVANFTKGWMDFYNLQYGTGFVVADSLSPQWTTSPPS